MAGQKLLKNRASLCTIILFVYSVFLNSCSTLINIITTEDIFIDNQVEECIEIIPNEIMYKSGSVYLNTKWKTIKSTGFCGCKSALLSYKVIAKKNDVNSMVNYKEFSSLNHDDFDFLVCSDFQKKYDSFEIYIQCKSPE
jgi:hypothetical protein